MLTPCRTGRTAENQTMVHLSQTRRALIWAVMAALVGLLCVLGFRGYLSSEMLLNFANMFYC
jgi:hypothetical protein